MSQLLFFAFSVKKCLDKKFHLILLQMAFISTLQIFNKHFKTLEYVIPEFIKFLVFRVK